MLTINCKGKLIDLSIPKVMGILNLTPDSFYDGGKNSDEKKVLQQVEKMLSEGARLGAVVIDEGSWWDLGSRTAYLAAHAALNGMYGPALDPGAQIESGAILRGTNVVGPGAVIESGAQLEDTIVWPGGRVVRGAELKRCIVRSGITAAGIVEDADF